MKYKWIFIGLGLGLLLACQSHKNNSSIVKLGAEQLYNTAGDKVREMAYDSAIVLLRQAFEEGMEKPMRIVTDSNFYDLIDNPNYRPLIRLLVEEFTDENEAVMVRQSEQSQPLFIKGLIVDQLNNVPLKRVSVELVHTDSDGFYFKEKTKWNPRLFAYLKTDSAGEFSIRTIKPGKYKDDEGNYVPAHIHFTLKKEGYRIYASEFTFEDDPIFKANGNTEGILVAKLKDVQNNNQYQITISLQRN